VFSIGSRILECLLVGNWSVQTVDIIATRMDQGSCPRLIYGTFENYVLNAPQRYLCKTCEATNKKENERSVPENERTQYNFLTTDSEVFVQIEEENPSLLLIIL
jgi:transposase-like protein